MSDRLTAKDQARLDALDRRKDWPCGCITGVEPGGVFLIHPCSTDCQVYKIAMRESRAQGNEMRLE